MSTTKLLLILTLLISFNSHAFFFSKKTPSLSFEIQTINRNDFISFYEKDGYIKKERKLRSRDVTGSVDVFALMDGYDSHERTRVINSIEQIANVYLVRAHSLLAIPFEPNSFSKKNIAIINNSPRTCFVTFSIDDFEKQSQPYSQKFNFDDGIIYLDFSSDDINFNYFDVNDFDTLSINCTIKDSNYNELMNIKKVINY